ncbi:hypothetical protein [Methanoregula sp. UBA64]|uniref:hypothetical protein n=1 Tax=Methanoregula sp. UBA64 TaxID=1915554 RepID=UPI0025F4AB39|nr:hypothetical protein [Methanoregula sp. UBA64]
MVMRAPVWRIDQCWIRMRYKAQRSWKKRDGNFPGPGYFSCREKKKPEFFWPRKILPARTIRIFFQKIRIPKNSTPKKNLASQMYIRLSDNYPIIGLLTYSSFSREKENYRIIARP